MTDYFTEAERELAKKKCPQCLELIDFLDEELKHYSYKPNLKEKAYDYYINHKNEFFLIGAITTVGLGSLVSYYFLQ